VAIDSARAPEDLVIFNLGCGARTARGAVNIDWSPLIRAKRSRIGRVMAPLIVGRRRLEAFRAMSDSVLVHDLRKGIPAADESVDMVYHSHVIEHMDRDAVPDFLSEVRRVLRSSGIHRIVTPDLETLVRRYHQSLHHGPPERHDQVLAAILEQSVRKESAGTSQQGPLRRSLERIVLGDARRRGETHQWLWDRVNLAVALETAGFQDVRVVDFKTSAVDGWSDLHLDCDHAGREYRPGSLYVEARPTSGR
jgi:SAM-dependent methyltransferase